MLRRVVVPVRPFVGRREGWSEHDAGDRLRSCSSLLLSDVGQWTLPTRQVVVIVASFACSFMNLVQACDSESDLV